MLEHELVDNLELISDVLGLQISDHLEDGLEDGNHPEYGYDEQLVKDIADAIEQWCRRSEYATGK